MPTKKPRLAITLTPETRAALERLSEASGIASSQFISQMMHDAIPVIDAMAKAFAEAKRSPMRAAEVMRDALGEAHLHAAQEQLRLNVEIEKKKRKLRKRPTK